MRCHCSAVHLAYWSVNAYPFWARAWLNQWRSIWHWFDTHEPKMDMFWISLRSWWVTILQFGYAVFMVEIFYVRMINSWPISALGLKLNEGYNKEILTAMRVMVVSIGSRGSHLPAMTPRRLRRGVIAGMWDPRDPIETTMTRIFKQSIFLLYTEQYVFYTPK